MSTSALQATESWLPQPVAAKVGDAFTRTITVRAQMIADRFNAKQLHR